MDSSLTPGSVNLKEQGEYNMPNAMLYGRPSVKAQLEVGHPLELKEQNYKDSVYQTNLKILKATQGIHAPLRLLAERSAASKIQRLPCLPSSNLMLETLDGSDETITFEDILNDPTQPERMAPPHIMIERQLKLL